MSMKYIRDYYGVPAYRGRRVMVDSEKLPLKEGVITGSRGQYVRVRLDCSVKGVKARSLNYHPKDLIYQDPDFAETGRELDDDGAPGTKPMF